MNLGCMPHMLRTLWAHKKHQRRQAYTHSKPGGGRRAVAHRHCSVDELRNPRQGRHGNGVDGGRKGGADPGRHADGQAITGDVLGGQDKLAGGKEHCWLSVQGEGAGGRCRDVSFVAALHQVALPTLYAGYGHRQRRIRLRLGVHLDRDGGGVAVAADQSGLVDLDRGAGKLGAGGDEGVDGEGREEVAGDGQDGGRLAGADVGRALLGGDAEAAQEAGVGVGILEVHQEA
jgi:hypothetical protein